MGMCGGSAPAAPDPVATANAQGTMNKDTAIAQANLNRINQSTPFGSLTYTQNGVNADGTPQYTATTALSPEMQQLYNAQMQQDKGLTDTSNALIGQINSTMGKPIGQTQPLNSGMSPDQFNQWTNAFKTTAGPASTAGSAAAGFNSAGFSSAGPAATYGGASATAGHTNAAQANGWEIQKQLQGAGDLQGQFNAAREAALRSQQAYTNPLQEQARTQLNNQLRQQGITQESNPAAWQHAMDQINRDQTFQNQQAYDSSFNTGLASAGQLFNQSLQAGQFANSAQQQGFDQSAWNAGQRNQVGMANAANATQASIASAANQNAAGISSMQGRNQQNQFNAGQANATNQFNAGQANAANQFNAGLESANNQFNAGQLNSMSQANAQLNNASQQAVMNGYLNNANVNNAASNQQMQQLFALRNQPINELASLRSMTPIQSPQFQQTPQVNLQSPDLMGAVNNNYNSQLASYNNQQSGMMGMAGTAAMAAAMFF